jgi:hypothetical protein
MRRGVELGSAVLLWSLFLLVLLSSVLGGLLWSSHRQVVGLRSLGDSCVAANELLAREVVGVIRDAGRVVGLCEAEKVVLGEQLRLLTLNQSSCPVAVVVVDAAAGVERVNIQYDNRGVSA